MHVLATCHAAAMQARALGVDATRVHVVREAVEPPAERPVASLHALVGVASTTTIVGGAGRLAGAHGVDTFIRAAALVERRVPGCQFAWIGDGPQLPWLQQVARAVGVASRFHFVAGDDDLAPLLASLAVFVHSSGEGLSMPALEAMAAGRPFIGTYAGALPEIVSDGECGLLVEPSAPIVLADAIVALLEHPERAAALGAAARERVQPHHSPDGTTGALLSLLTNVAQRPAAAEETVAPA